MKNKKLIAIALMALITAWFFRFENLGNLNDRKLLLNRWTGEVVAIKAYGRHKGWLSKLIDRIMPEHEYPAVAPAPKAVMPAPETAPESNKERKRKGMFDDLEYDATPQKSGGMVDDLEQK